MSDIFSTSSLPLPRASASIGLIRGRSTQNRSLRALLHSAIFPQGPSGDEPRTGDEARQIAALNQLAGTFTRYAGTQQTVYDNGGGQAGSVGGGNKLERQVERALVQVLGRSPGRGNGGFTSALDAAFPLDGYGRISATPTRSVVSMYANGNGVAGSLINQLSVEQAALYRQASTIIGDTQQVLAGIEPFVAIADRDRIEALRALIRSELNALTDEFGRVDKPRPQRVESYFDLLIGSNGHVIQLGHRAFLDRQRAAPTTTEDEGQIAGFELLRRYIDMLQTAWQSYSQPQSNVRFPAFSDRLTRAQTLLPSIAAANNAFMTAMDAVGFPAGERRTEAARVTRLAPASTVLPLPDLTVDDLNEWIEHFASIEAPSVLDQSGQYGLEFVTGHADSLFIVLAPVLAHVRILGLRQIGSMPLVAQILTHERVSWALSDMIEHVFALADLAA
jgi:hypothetical protein